MNPFGRRKKPPKLNNTARDEGVGSSNATGTRGARSTPASPSGPSPARGLTARSRFRTSFTTSAGSSIPNRNEPRSPHSPTPGEATRDGHPYLSGYKARLGKIRNRAHSEDPSDGGEVDIRVVQPQGAYRGADQGNKKTRTLHIAIKSRIGLPSSPRNQIDMTPPPQQEGTSPTALTAGAVGIRSLQRAPNFNIHNLPSAFARIKPLESYLGPYVASGAAHNSDERRNAPTCHKDTRVLIRENAVSWIRRGNQSVQIMWISGPAGCGKSAIAGSVAQECSDAGLLAASFFFSSFSSSAGRHTKRCVITTIASHLAKHELLREFKEQLLFSIERNPSIFRKTLKEQAECLLLAPLRFLQGRCDMALWPKGIILDGLDEVVAYHAHMGPFPDGRNDQVEILDVLLTLSQSPSFPFRILIFSRPERHISDFFAANEQSVALQLSLDSKFNPDADVECFLKSRFAQIWRHFAIPSWPKQSVFDRLVGMSSGQFIVATTIIRWVEFGDPQKQLEELLRLQREIIGSKTPFAGLDALYRHILGRACNHDGDPHLVIKWILAITSAALPRSVYHPHPAGFWRGFLEDLQGELNRRMAPMASLISVPPPDNSSSPITVYHKSLTDFLSTKARCGNLYVNETEYDSFLSDRIVLFLKGPRSLSTTGCRYLDEILGLRLVGFSAATTQDRVSQYTASFLRSLSMESGDDLASCDPAWWARLSSLTDRSLIEGIYCGIHKALCNPKTPFSPCEQDRKCHPACVLWRTGILTTAKQNSWCVHELEEIAVDQLEDLTFEDVESRVRELGQQDDGLFLPPCDVCQPGPDPEN